MVDEMTQLAHCWERIDTAIPDSSLLGEETLHLRENRECVWRIVVSGGEIVESLLRWNAEAGTLRLHFGQRTISTCTYQITDGILRLIPEHGYESSFRKLDCGCGWC
jgi:hypothetical protein